MNALADPQNAASRKMSLHCGGEWKTEQEVRDIPTPAPIAKHHPTDFGFFMNATQNGLVKHGYALGDAAWATSHDNQRLFGVIEANLKPDPARLVGQVHDVYLNAGDDSTKYSATLKEIQNTEGDAISDWRDGHTFWKAEVIGDYYNGMTLLAYLPDNSIGVPSSLTHLVGIRASHDKSFSNQLVMGTRVFVCDNMAFNGQILIRRRNTVGAKAALPALLDRAVNHIAAGQDVENKRVEAYQNTECMDVKAESTILRAMEHKIVASPKWQKILEEYRNPKVEHEGGGNTLWGLKNAFTEGFKAYSLNSMPERCIKLNGVLDEVAGFKPAVASIIDID